MARPIDRGEVLYQLERLALEAQLTDECEEETIRRCIAAVKLVPTLTPPNEWVSVENALPPEHEPVLCIVNGKPKANITLEEAYQLGSWNKADGWIIDEYLDWEDADVSWWRKLPEPPGRRPPGRTA